MTVTSVVVREAMAAGLLLALLHAFTRYVPLIYQWGLLVLAIYVIKRGGGERECWERQEERSATSILKTTSEQERDILKVSLS